MPDVSDAIAKVALFSQLSKKDIKHLSSEMTERSFPAGAVICEKGKPGLGFFIIENGTASVSVDDKTVATLGPGDHFGEIALIDEGPRMAEVKADTDIRCYALTAWQFRPFVKDHPDVAWQLLQSLVQRIVRDPSAGDQ
jgi:CRP-like cAMP-binding protein